MPDNPTTSTAASTSINFCEHCGKPRNAGNFCVYCGAPLAPHAQSAATDQPNAEQAPGSEPGVQRPEARPSAAAEGGGPSADPQPSVQSREWLPIAAVVALVLTLVGGTVVLLVALGGEAGNDVKVTAPPDEKDRVRALAADTTLYSSFQTSRLIGVNPAGWSLGHRDQRQGQELIATWIDPLARDSQLEIASQPGAKSAANRAEAARSDARRQVDYRQRSFGKVRLAGGRSAYLLAFTSVNGAEIDYFFNRCKTGVRVRGIASRKRIAELQPRLDVVAAVVQPKC